MVTLKRWRVIPDSTAPGGSVRPTLVHAYVGAGGPTASQLKMTSCPADTDVSVGVAVRRGGPDHDMKVGGVQ